MRDIIINGTFCIVGFALAILYDWLKDKYRFRRELRQNNEIDLTGDDWVAAWQTSVDGQEVINTEEILIQQRGGIVKIHNREKSPENPKGGYKWNGQLQFYQGRDLMGGYFSNEEEQNTNKGMMYFCYQSARKEFVGRWVGTSYDGPLLSGFAVISKSKEQSLGRLKELVTTHPDKVPIISYAL